MNAAARAIDNVGFFRGSLKSVSFDVEWMKVGLLLVAILVSAIAIVLNKNEQRVYFSQVQMAEQTENRLKLEWGQLLLERTSLATPQRVQGIAAQKFNMIFPNHKRTLILR